MKIFWITCTLFVFSIHALGEEPKLNAGDYTKCYAALHGDQIHPPFKGQKDGKKGYFFLDDTGSLAFFPNEEFEKKGREIALPLIEKYRKRDGYASYQPVFIEPTILGKKIKNITCMMEVQPSGDVEELSCFLNSYHSNSDSVDGAINVKSVWDKENEGILKSEILKTIVERSEDIQHEKPSWASHGRRFGTIAGRRFDPPPTWGNRLRHAMGGYSIFKDMDQKQEAEVATFLEDKARRGDKSEKPKLDGINSIEKVVELSAAKRTKVAFETCAKINDPDIQDLAQKKLDEIAREYKFGSAALGKDQDKDAGEADK